MKYELCPHTTICEIRQIGATQQRKSMVEIAQIKVLAERQLKQIVLPLMFSTAAMINFPLGSMPSKLFTLFFFCIAAIFLFQTLSVRSLLKRAKEVK